MEELNVKMKFFGTDEVVEIVPIPSEYFGYSLVGVETANGLYTGGSIRLVPNGIVLDYVQGYDKNQKKNISCKRRCIIFGAPDIEEQRARKIAAQYGLATATATAAGVIVNPMTAYRADGYAVDGETDEFMDCIIFECSPSAAVGLNVIARCDHHNPGDAGFGLGPEKYFEASSLGQLLNFLGIEPTHEDMVIAAADHCLAAAYAGECPGVTAEEVLAMRLPEIMKRENVSSEADAMAGIEAAVKLLQDPTKTVTLGGVEVADVCELGPIPFLVEAGVMTGTAYLAKGDKRFPDKVNLSGPQPVVAEFLGEAVMIDGRPTYPNGWAAQNGLHDCYGNPGRGFAGGYDKPQA